MMDNNYLLPHCFLDDGFRRCDDDKCAVSFDLLIIDCDDETFDFEACQTLRVYPSHHAGAYPIGHQEKKESQHLLVITLLFLLNEFVHSRSLCSSASTYHVHVG